MILTRENLQNGRYLASFDDLPGQPRWSPERIRASLQQTLAQRPPGQPVWLFAYGSLIWNPLFEPVARAPALLTQWQRRFCMLLLAGRACPIRPGRMLSLDAGGQCTGMVLQMPERKLEHELMLVWTREMVYGSYRPIWAPVVLGDGRQLQALVFVADPAQPQYTAVSDIETIAPLIARAQGPLGRNSDYVLQLDATLQRHDISDPHVHAVAQAVHRVRTSVLSRK